LYTSCTSVSLLVFLFFFFQAEDGIRDFHVTGVQTCALPIFALALLLLAAWAGLVRMGWPWPLPARLVLLHGPVVIGGFFGTVIGLERAVAIARPWAYGAPAGAALGTLLLASGLAPLPGIVLLIAAGVVLCAVYVVAYGRQPAPFTAVMGLG